jgi:peptidoglycan-N-acetylglucosamine deacetylase
MELRSRFLSYPRYGIITATVLGLLGTCLLLPSRLADPKLPVVQNSVAHVIPEAAHIINVPAEFQGKIIKQVQLGEGEKAIALTFDDGPWPKNTEQVLNILKQNNIKATFFWIGKNLKDHPDIARKVVAEGHAIGNHTWHHWYFRMNKATAAAEVENTAKLIEDTTGVKTFLFRPPGGFLNNGPANYARSKNYAVMMWTAEPGEFRRRNTVVNYINNVVNTATPGGIVLMHDAGNHQKTIQALPQIIAKLKLKGYRFVTLPQLLEMQAKKTLSSKPKSSQIQRIASE